MKIFLCCPVFLLFIIATNLLSEGEFLKLIFFPLHISFLIQKQTESLFCYTLCSPNPGELLQLNAHLERMHM